MLRLYEQLPIPAAGVPGTDMASSPNFVYYIRNIGSRVGIAFSKLVQIMVVTTESDAAFALLVE